MRRSRRRGFSLLEVLLATGILIGSSIVLMELASIGIRHAAGARDLAQMQRICQSKLNEIVIGVAPAETVRPMPCDEVPSWTYWVNLRPTDRPGLVMLEVGVSKDMKSRRSTSRFTLVRWIRDPKTDDESPSSIPLEAAPRDIALGGPMP